MSRKEKQIEIEDKYKSRLADYGIIYKEKVEFASKFKLSDYDDSYATYDDSSSEESSSDSSAEGEGSAVASKVEGNSNIEKAWNFFAGKGFTEAATAGVLGNLNQESKFDTRVINSIGAAYLCQWYRSRRTAIEAEAKKQGRDLYSIEFQLDYLWWELTVGEPNTISILNKRFGGIEALKNATDYKWAVKAFENSFEISGNSAMDKREKYAKEYLDKYGKGNASGKASIVGTSNKEKKNDKKENTLETASFTRQEEIQEKKELDIESYNVAYSPQRYSEHKIPLNVPHGKFIRGMFNPPKTKRTDYAKNKLEDAILSEWKDWAPIRNSDFIHVSGPQENFYSKESILTFQKLKERLGWKKIKIINGFQKNKKKNITSMHNVGMAMDIEVRNIQEALFVADTAWSIGIRAIAIGGSNLSNNGAGFVHIDCGPNHYWSLNGNRPYRGPNTFALRRDANND